MPLYELHVVLDRIPQHEDYDRIYEAGLDDSTPETRNGRGVLTVHREAETEADAIASVVADVSASGFTAVTVDLVHSP